MTNKEKNLTTLPLILLLVLDLILFTLLMFVRGAFDGFLLTVCIVKVFVDWGTVYAIVKGKLGSPMIPCVVMALTSIGLVVQGRLSPSLGIKQFVFVLLGVLCYFITALFWKKLTSLESVMWWSYGSIIGLFLVTLLLGKSINGARNWIVFAGISIQPSELIKVLFAIFISAYLSDVKRNASPYSKPILMVLVFLMLGFFAVQREFGTALVIFCAYIAVLFAFEPKVWHIIPPIAFAGFGAVFAALKIPHLMVRMEAWLNPWADMAGKGYQITQSLFAIGSGGLFGSGLGRGYPKLIPNVTTDFVFSAIYEEMGFLVAAGLLLLYFFIVYIAFQAALSLKEGSMKRLAYTLGAIMGIQVLVILAGVTKLMPLTGITLPLISYGGSSMLVTFIMLGILQALTSKVGREGAYYE